MPRTHSARRFAAVLVTTVVIAAGAGGGPANAAERCAVSTKTVDNPAYSGPWPDNWDFTVKACVTESGPNIRHWATISWDLPASTTHPGSIFNTANAEVTAMVAGGGLAVTKRTDLAQRLNKAKDGSITPASYSSHWPSRHHLYTDVTLLLDWKGDGKGPQKLHFTPSPSIPGSAH
ncbi:hypothetical protein [Streptomyces sp. NPDC001594]|uniref:hypothetical protein n=1 Tax=Streptomyces sp. NPDC001594 TaxID=3364590 RepID=UPI0036C519FB